MKKKLFRSPRQKEIYEMIKSFAEKNYYFPSYKELCKNLHISLSTLHEHIENLVKDKWIGKKKNSKRAFLWKYNP